MAEYIEREALLSAIETSWHNNPHSQWLVAKTHNDEHAHFLSMTLAQPVADVVEVVRCKDCHFWDTDHKGLNGECVCKLHSLINVFTTYKLPDSFCNNGERRSDNG